MSDADFQIDDGEVMQQVTLKATFPHWKQWRLKVRVWLGMQLVKAAARIMGCNIEFSFEVEE